MKSFLLKMTFIWCIVPLANGIDVNKRSAFEDIKLQERNSLTPSTSSSNQPSNLGLKTINDSLEASVRSNNIEGVAAALSQGANIETCGFAGGSPLTWAAERNFIEIAALLLYRRANPNASDFEWTALMLAASKGYLQMCELLLNNGALVNLNDVYGRTPLNLAAANGHLDVVKLLMARGADKSYQNCEQKTAQEIAMQKNHAEIAEYLQYAK